MSADRQNCNGKGPGAGTNLLIPKISRRPMWLELKEQPEKVLNESGGHGDNSSEEFYYKEQRNWAGARGTHELCTGCFCFLYFVLR